jgi:hypothetical protein
MINPMKIAHVALLLLSAVLATAQPRPQTTQPAVWDGSAQLSKAEQSLEGLPAKEASELRALLVSNGRSRYDDRVRAWLKTSLKEDLKPVADYAVASLRAMAEAGDAAAMWYLHFVLTQRIETGDEGFRWLAKAAKSGYPRAVFDMTKERLKGQPDKLREAMEDFAKHEDEAGMQALYWFAFSYEKGQHGLPKDAAKATDYQNRAKALGDKLYAAEKGK